MFWERYSLLNIAEWSSGSSAGSLPEGRMFESSLRNHMAGVAEWIGEFELTQYDYHTGSTPVAGPKHNWGCSSDGKSGANKRKVVSSSLTFST